MQKLVDTYADCDHGIATVLYWACGWFSLGITPALIAMKMNGQLYLCAVIVPDIDLLQFVSVLV